MHPKNFNHACAHLVHKESVKLSLSNIKPTASRLNSLVYVVRFF